MFFIFYVVNIIFDFLGFPFEIKQRISLISSLALCHLSQVSTFETWNLDILVVKHSKFLEYCFFFFFFFLSNDLIYFHSEVRHWIDLPSPNWTISDMILSSIFKNCIKLDKSKWKWFTSSWLHLLIYDFYRMLLLIYSFTVLYFFFLLPFTSL